VIVAFRVDASRDVGSGHVMRCLSLADSLASRGRRCTFLCRPAPGDLIGEIERRGHAVIRMPSPQEASATSESDDARDTCEALSGFSVEWLIVDHYGLGITWEQSAGACARGLLAIDDVGRDHECSLLLDQNFPNPMHERYRLSLADAKLILGPQYALLQGAFAASRHSALERRTGLLVRFLVSMGASDPSNATAKALAGLEAVWQKNWHVDVVIGSSNPHGKSLDALCSKLPAAALHVQTTDMARLMTEADCAIGAGGSTTWERCCLGLPSLVCILSSDQAAIATAVARTGAHILLGYDQELAGPDYAREIAALSQPQLLAMSISAAAITDGMGANRVAERLQ
jgi:UDP-2,4-diacetamido-2,4,6-trideoxy-beta-L-altropyranose hydrolase